MKLTVLADAEAEIRSAFAYLEEQTNGLGERLLVELADTLDAIGERPLSFVKLETLPPEEPYRRALLPTFRYAVVFEVHESEIVIVAVPHTSRESNYWLKRLR